MDPERAGQTDGRGARAIVDMLLERDALRLEIPAPERRERFHDPARLTEKLLNRTNEPLIGGNLGPDRISRIRDLFLFLTPICFAIGVVAGICMFR